MRSHLRTSPPPSDAEQVETSRVGPVLLWFGVLGGVVAWFVHLGVAWGVLELACISPAPGELVDNRGGSPGTVAWTIVAAGTAIPWLVAASALGACLVSRRRHRRLDEAGLADVLAGERVPLLLTVGILLDLFALAAITGGIVAMLTLEACG